MNIFLIPIFFFFSRNTLLRSDVGGFPPISTSGKLHQDQWGLINAATDISYARKLRLSKTGFVSLVHLPPLPPPPPSLFIYLFHFIFIGFENRPLFSPINQLLFPLAFVSLKYGNNISHFVPIIRFPDTDKLHSCFHILYIVTVKT